VEIGPHYAKEAMVGVEIEKKNGREKERKELKTDSRSGES